MASTLPAFTRSAAMMRSLARRGKTVLVSSHILSEVQQIADTVTIIGRGRLLAEGDVSQILAADGQVSARVRVSDHLRATEVLTTVRLHRRAATGRLLKVSLINHKLDLAVITPAAGRSGSVRLRAHTDPARPRIGVLESDGG